MNNAILITPGHIRHAKVGLVEAGIQVGAGVHGLYLATRFYRQIPQVNQSNALRR